MALGSAMVSSITVSNGGPRVATGPLRVVEVLTGETFVSASGTGWACAATGDAVVCDHANVAGLAVNAALATLRITGTASSAGAVANAACTGASVPAGAGAATASPPAEGDPNSGNDCVTVTATSTTVRPDLAIAKATSTPTGADKTVGVSESQVTNSLVVSNVSVGADSATGVRVSDSVPGFIAGRTTFAAFAPVVAAGGATFNCSASGATVTCVQTAGSLAPGQSGALPLTVNRPLADGSFTNTATVSNTVEGDPNAANNTANETVVIAPIADVQMTGKQVTPAAVRAGENATDVLSFRNNGPSAALGVVAGDSFNFPVGDSGFTVVSLASAKAGSSCNLAAGAVVSAASPSPALTCSIGGLANGETESITVVLRPNFQAGNAARSFANTARITTSSREAPDGSDNGNNSQAATLAVNPAALNLLVNKTDVVDPVPHYTSGTGPQGGTFLDYQVALNNAGPSYGTGVKVTETMAPPAAKRVRFVCDTVAAGSATCNAPALSAAANISSAAGVVLPAFTCDVPAGTAATGAARGDLASGATKTVFLRFEALDQPEPHGDVFSNTAAVSANEPDTSVDNDIENEATTTRQRIDLRVAKTSSAASVALNEPFTWTIAVENRGPGNSLRTDLTDTLPAGAELTGAVGFIRSLPAGSGTCTVAASVLTCALGQLNANGLATISVPARFASFPAGGAGTNTATVDTDPAKTGGIDTPGGNNSGTSTVAASRASLSGMVFQDRDRAGANGGTPQAAAADPRLAGVVARLTGTEVVQEVASQGSGPYGLRNNTVVEGSEKVEVLVRDRQQSARIVSVRALARLVDYSFEPFSGRIILSQFLPSVDDQRNPVTLRVTYEVDQGGDAFWVLGADAQWQITPGFEIGGSLVQDRNGLAPYDLGSANATLRLGPRTALVAEVARSQASVNTIPTNQVGTPALAGKVGEVAGHAWRVELAHEGEAVDARLFVGRTSPLFNNAAAPLNGGRGEARGLAAWRFAEGWKLQADALASEDRNPGGGERKAAGLGLQWLATERLTLDLGLRTQRETVGTQGNGWSTQPFADTAGLGGSIATGSAGGALGFGNQAVDPGTGLPVIGHGGLATAVSSLPAGMRSRSDTVRLGLGWRATERFSLGAEAEHEVNGDDRRACTASTAPRSSKPRLATVPRCRHAPANLHRAPSCRNACCPTDGSSCA